MREHSGHLTAGLIISLGNAVTGSIVAEVVRLRFLPFRPEVSRLRLLLAFRKVMINALTAKRAIRCSFAGACFGRENLASFEKQMSY
jgi:hypothetical protein